MALGGTFLGSAKGRLLAPSIPFRFFGTATLFQLLAWLALFWAAPAVPGFTAGLGWPLAALHLFTLGVLVMTAVGASLQLLPVASRQAPVAAPWPYRALWLLLSAGVLGLGAGLAGALPTTLAGAAFALALALLLYLVLLAKNLLGARGMPLVIAHGWVASLSLLLVLGSGVSLALFYSGWAVLERDTALRLHVTYAAYGFMGMLVMGLSSLLVPMFALAQNPSPRWSAVSFALATGALLLALPLALGVWARQLLGWVVGLGAIALLIHVLLMWRALRSGMRQGLGKPFLLVRLGWALLLASLAAVPGLEAPWMAARPALFGLLLLGGLLTLALGMLSRIVPFLASMHAGAGMRRPPTPSSLTAQRPLDLHFYGHTAAMVVLIIAVLVDSVWLVRVGAALGLFAAAAFGAFVATAWRRMMQTAAQNAAPGAPLVPQPRNIET